MHEWDKHIKKDFRAAECDDQLELAARVGRGVKGDSFKVKVDDDDMNQTRTVLHGYTYDETIKDWIKVWDSKNINGGRLFVSEAININNSPKTFTLTFRYERPGRKTWNITTPAIPYINDNPRIGCDVSDIFLKDHTQHTAGVCDKWKDVLAYDQGLPRETFNPPTPPGGIEMLSPTKLPSKYTGGSWSVSLDITEFEELASLLGWSYEDLVQAMNASGSSEKYLKAQSEKFSDVASNNVRDFIEQMLLKHAEDHEKDIQELKEKVNELIKKEEQNRRIIKAIVDKIYGTNTINFDAGTISWENIGENGKIPLGNINVYGWPGGNQNDGGALWTHSNGSNVKGDILAK